MVETLPTAAQPTPALVEYCHDPLPKTFVKTATPWSAPASTSLIDVPTMFATVMPALLTASSVREVITGLVGASTGASFTALTTIWNVWVGELSCPPYAVPPLSNR